MEDFCNVCDDKARCNDIGHCEKRSPAPALRPTSAKPNPIPMLLWCPECRMRHIDKGEFATKEHHTHACQGCGMVWRPAVVPTVGVEFLPGFKDAPSC